MDRIRAITNATAIFMLMGWEWDRPDGRRIPNSEDIEDCISDLEQTALREAIKDDENFTSTVETGRLKVICYHTQEQGYIFEYYINIH